MKTRLFLLFVVFAVTLTACEQKNDLAAKASEAGEDVRQKVQESAQPVRNDVAKKTKEIVDAGKEGVKKSAPAVKETSDQFLAETITHGREITKTQNSESREHGQKTEDEMMVEIEKRK